jgi:hypothetical protein
LFQDYGDKLEEPPAKKKKRDGPVRISIPTLKDLHKNLEEEGQSRELDTEKNPPRLEIVERFARSILSLLQYARTVGNSDLRACLLLQFFFRMNRSF